MKIDNSMLPQKQHYTCLPVATTTFSYDRIYRSLLIHFFVGNLAKYKDKLLNDKNRLEKLFFFFFKKNNIIFEVKGTYWFEKIANKLMVHPQKFKCP